TEFQVPYSVMYQDSRGAMKRLRELMGGKIFDFPKDEEILLKLIETIPSDDSIILDFFSGSASTAHATMKKNAEDKGKRKFIMIQLPEEVEVKSEAEKAGYKNISEIGQERSEERRVGKESRSRN